MARDGSRRAASAAGYSVSDSKRPEFTRHHTPTQDRTPQRNFGPDVQALARFIATTAAPADSVALLVEINRRWPGLSFRDFMGARVLAAAWGMETWGRA
jgi:hypothetical protein